MSRRIDTYYCPECRDYELEKMNLHDDKPDTFGECPTCEVPLKRGLSNPSFCLVVDNGGSRSRMVANGKFSADQAAREKARLEARTLAYVKSPAGEEKMMAQRERLGKRWDMDLPVKPFRPSTWK